MPAGMKGASHDRLSLSSLYMDVRYNEGSSHVEVRPFDTFRDLKTNEAPSFFFILIHATTLLVGRVFHFSYLYDEFARYFLSFFSVSVVRLRRLWAFWGECVMASLFSGGSSSCVMAASSGSGAASGEALGEGLGVRRQ